MTITPYMRRQVLLLILLLLSLIILVRVALPLMADLPLWSGDFETYWLSGRLFLRGENPYSLPAMQSLRVETGIKISDSDGVPRYFPWIIPIMASMGIFDLQTGRLVWILVYITAIFASTEFFWQRYGGSSSQRWLAHLLALTFAPTIFVIGRTQMSPLVLLGITGVLYSLSQPRRDWLAGISLLLLSIKPHIVYLFALVLLFWVLRNQRWGVIWGGAAALFGVMVLALPFNPTLVWQYLTAEQVNYGQLDWATPALGNFLRSLFGYENVWLQVLPPLVGLVWLCWHWILRKANWDWLTETPLLLVASIVSAVFVWTYDQVILIPVVLHGAVLLAHIGTRKLKGTLILVTLVANFAVVWLHRTFDDAWFAWYAPTLLVLYLMALRVSSRRKENSPLPLETSH